MRSTYGFMLIILLPVAVAFIILVPSILVAFDIALINFYLYFILTHNTG